MSGHGVRRAAAVGLVLSSLAAPPAAFARDRGAERARAADSLRAHAATQLALHTLDGRRQAMTDLEQASLLAPGDHEVWLDLGRLCLEIGERRRGRHCYERAQEAAPDNADARAELGAAWVWEWLSSFERDDLAHAEQALARAAELDPTRAGTWARLAALLVSRGRAPEAERAARRGLAADPGAWDPLVALACAAYREGELARADSAFAVARARAPESLRARFAAATWAGHAAPVDATSSLIADPDLTTPENEAELDFLTRLGLALLLFRDAHGLRWDMRTELFVRYGPPATVEVNPLSSPLARHFERHEPDERPPGFVGYTPPPLDYPFSLQAWSYPELGIRAELWDRSLTQRFELPPTTEVDADPKPNGALLAARPDLVSLGGGRGVFRAMPPNSKPVPARGQVARFPSDQGVLLLSHVMTPGEPADSLTGTWAVVANDGRVLARGSAQLSASACDPTALRVAEFSAVVPAGDYRVDLAVSGTGGRRGLVRLHATAPSPPAGLDLSDLVMLCGAADAALVTQGAVRIEPDPERRFSGSGSLAAYFELDHLRRGSDGLSHFAYTYSLHPISHEDDRVGAAVYQASREESYDGAHRRQFVTVPMRAIKAGTYELRIAVRDVVAGSEVAGALRFERD